jgi:uncharacterized glyoxalase superfamily protein PhnB
MQPTPPDWPRIAPALFYDDAGSAIDWLCEAFGFEVRLRVDGVDGRVEHSELEYGEGLVMVGSAGGSSERPGPQPWRSPRTLGGANTQSLCVYVDDVDAHCARSRTAGAKILDEPKTDDYGEEWGANRTYRVEDPEGHHWWFMTRVRAPETDA